MTKQQGVQILDWLTVNGFSGVLSAALDDLDGTTIRYTVIASGSGDAAKMRKLFDNVESRGLAISVTSVQILDPPTGTP
jgi:hypothetical protein